MNKIFVYGTLKEGGYFDNNRLVKNRDSVTKAHIENFKLLDLGAFPGIVPSENKNLKVHGEIHEFKDINNALELIDKIEGYDETNKEDSLYVRKTANALDDNGNKVKVFVYVFNQYNKSKKHRVVESGVW
jgi:gamma-glutamylcyclotransferase (GGCT)/AIG2-like uncharacterized protein YtfP